MPKATPINGHTHQKGMERYNYMQVKWPSWSQACIQVLFVITSTTNMKLIAASWTFGPCEFCEEWRNLIRHQHLSMGWTAALPLAWQD
jgi:hypothetical protein